MPADIFNFESPDLVNLQTWYRRAPKRFSRAVTGVVNSLAFQARSQAVKNIQAGTITRNPRFVSASMRVEKARNSSSLNRIVSQMGSIDLSRKGRSSGFEELEIGSQSTSHRVPTLFARAGGNAQKKVSPAVRFNKFSKFHKHKQFRGRAKTKQGQVAAMLKAIRTRRAQNKPFIIPAGLTGRMAGMTPGIWKRKGQSLQLANPFKGKRGKTKRLAWMLGAVTEVSKRGNLRKIWRKEIDFMLRLKR